MIDWNRVAELRDEIGAEDFGEVAELFLMEVEETLSNLDKAVSDPAQMQDLMHFLKGSALNLGFRAMSDVCGSAEADAAQGNIQVTPEALKKLYEDSRTQFETELDKRFAA